MVGVFCCSLFCCVARTNGEAFVFGAAEENHENFSHDRRLPDRRIGHLPDASLGRYRYLTLLGLCNYVSCIAAVCK